MGLPVLRSADHRRVPWKNGLGVTYEVAQSGDADFDWRLSFAEVDRPGPFSSFPEVDRIITLVSGDQLELTMPGEAKQVLRPFEPFAFPGEAEVWAETSTATVNFNVMTRRGRTAAEVVCRRIAGQASIDTSGFLVVLEGSLTVDGEVLGPRDVVRDPAVAVSGDAMVAVVALSPNP
ncbi:HutD family protein [Kribbella sp. NBC_01505]|uniref:HutD/Ves family protein n=1 Tax=Kribbella sp. NBC_01505 TaxID=2903580 RepID=UPI00386EBAA8